MTTHLNSFKALIAVCLLIGSLNCFGQVTTFSLQPDYVSVKTPTRTNSQPYYAFLDSIGWAGINCGNVSVTGQINASGTLTVGGKLTANDNFLGKNIYLVNNGNVLRFLPSNSDVEIGSSTGNLTFWYSGVGYTKLTCGNLIALGKIGIGTSEPDDPLTVNGTIHAQEVKIDLDVPADFVFGPEYKLMALQDVEQFVKTNNHLPEIPSASEIKQNGLNMGEMQNKLLQKIEEMTLYIISQQKQIDELQKQIAELKK